jgi:hypothetical protein
MTRHVECMGEKRNAYIILVGKPKGKRPPRRPSCRRSDNIKTYYGMAPKSQIIERPLLDNGSVATDPASFSGQQLNTFNRQHIYNRPLHGNATIVLKTEPLSKVCPRPSECGIYQ